MNQCRFSSDKARIIRCEKIKASESFARELPCDKVTAAVNSNPGVASLIEITAA